jgi:ketosteroid isomerase-like protein
MTNRHSVRIAAKALRALAALAVGVGLVTALSAATPAGDRAKVMEAMRSMYAAAANDDLARFRSVTAQDFYAFDNGKRFTGGELMDFVKSMHAAGKVYVWDVTGPEVHIDGNTAWITYVNKGSIQDGSGTANLSWLESAVLRKEDGSWRIQFLHSTRVPSD